MKDFKELLKKSDTELLLQYENADRSLLAAKIDAITAILNYRFSKRMIRLTWFIGILAVLQLVIMAIQIYLIIKK